MSLPPGMLCSQELDSKQDANSDHLGNHEPVEMQTSVVVVLVDMWSAAAACYAMEALAAGEKEAVAALIQETADSAVVV